MLIPSSAAPLAAADYIPHLPNAGRRSFVKYAGAVAATLTLASCSKHNEVPGTVNIGSADGGALNFAYAQEQLQAAFYAQVLAGAYFGNLAVGSAEQQVFAALALHQRIYVDLLKATIIQGKAAPIQALTADFSAVNFSSRQDILRTAAQLEDLAVAAYNGVARFFTVPAYLLLAAKIVSVKARHAALVRDLLTPNSFVANDVVTLTEGTSLERAQTPAQVAAAANNFLATGSKLNVINLA
ncbi:ferritin-like domain-containing protein [Hymenobacter sp. H14-R3]|uniref:ferritin-like domain-containing protein n=1 Tax=Hymenobacter sp. H14-R3 TaxID=3046308 RepID=UPI0024BA5C09|nr:ferritin-like domain-containing protein [Hymenobacter sp. H14-R3]MDJ0363648.1 ferritin-like domain-containing protein [Hymenobacter sp. H14-R3]